jgi:CRP-like cAMP-binding protein
MDKVPLDNLLLGRSPRSARDAPLGPGWADVLRDIPLFASLSKRQARRVANLARQQRFSVGTPIVRKGERGETFFVILDGEASLKLPNGKSRVLKAGDFLGELALFDGKPRSATVTARTPLLAMRISRRPFLKLVASDSELSLGLLKGLSERLRALSDAPE